MDLTLETLNNAFQPLKRLVAKELPAPIAWRLARTAAKLEGELKILNERHRALIEKYADKSGNVSKENTAAFEEEWAALMAETVNIDIKPIEIAQIPKNVALMPADLMLLFFMFKEDGNG